MEQQINQILNKSIEVKQKLNSSVIINETNQIIKALLEVFASNGSLWLCGNGGSAADALHLSAEFSGRFYKERKALPVEALNVNMAAITAIGNDYGFKQVFARMLEAKAKSGDFLWVLTTSGRSENIIQAVLKAKSMGVKIIAFTGENESAIDNHADFLIKIPSNDTPRIQECHLLLGHIIAELVENKI